ncbi:hypothetical protein [Caballeronia ptereochthonis]|uniref:Uncharacterized protein n=1 Tax=Caballeronia ptereochthonis TaxID=1777144 RepID=A0A158E478_9BURK|nr:hypothetical protein [Caballeronia ptereochthonis]SAL01701.1 hypothetical protein AWB83_06463 [Caballeronia ptereochthonis]
MPTIHAYDGYTSDNEQLNDLHAAQPSAAAPGQRFASALACLGAAYALSWAEFALMLAIGLPGDASSHPLAASIVSRVLVGLLYACVASRLQWARWLTVALGFLSVALVAPTIALQWHAFPAGAFVCGAALVCKLAASLYLLSPMPPRPAIR